MSTLLRTLTPAEVGTLKRVAVDRATLESAGRIVDDVRSRGVAAVREHAEKFGDIAPGATLVLDRPVLDDAVAQLDKASRGVLERAAERIRRFAVAQRSALLAVDMPIEGGRAGHRVVPVERAGCYVPGGRFPLPSTALMTVVTAKAAGVKHVVAASPRPTIATLAAAAIAGADSLLCVGGVQAIAAMAFGGAGLEAVGPCDVICGPGNRYVTAAKQLVAGSVRIDMLAGPSELVVLADSSADAGVVAADLLAQAEHDTDAAAILVTTDATLPAKVNAELAGQLKTLPTAATARAALGNGFVVVVKDLDEAVWVCDTLAPEHLQVIAVQAEALGARLRNYGALFVGAKSAEAMGDYGAGPNHTLPTGGTARAFSGLSVLTFVNVRTWLRVDDPSRLVGDTAALARLEGLEAHARSAEKRSGS